MDVSVIYPLIKSKETVLKNNPEHFVTGKNYFFSPGFRTSDIIMENILKGYAKTGGESIKDFFCGKLIFRHCFKKDKHLNKMLSDSVNQINGATDNNVQINDVVIACKDKNTDSIFLVTNNKLYAIVCNKYNNQKEYYGVLLSDIFVKNNGIDYVSGKHLTSGNDFNTDFVDFTREFKALNIEIDVTGCCHPMREKPIEHRQTYINILVDRCISDEYLTVNKVSRIEMLARLLGVSSSDVSTIISNSIGGMEKDCAAYIRESIKKAEKLEESNRYMLLHDLIVMDYFGKEKFSLEKVQRYTRAYIKYHKFPKVNLLAYRRAVHEFMKNSDTLKNILFQSQMLIGNRQICGKMFDSVTFQYSMHKPLQR